MARLARVVAVDVPHHVTQRGNARRFILDVDADRMVYLNLLRQNIELHGVSLIGYCLMSNHVHMVAIPHKMDGLARALKDTHGRYARPTGTRGHNLPRRPRMARAVLFLSPGQVAPVGSISLYGAESCAGGIGH